MKHINTHTLGRSADNSFQVISISFDSHNSLLDMLTFLHEHKIMYTQYYGHVFVSETQMDTLLPFIWKYNNTGLSIQVIEI